MAASRAAVALPIPLLPPVTSATFGIDSAGISMPVILSAASHRDLRGLDHGTPFGAFAVDECLEVFRGAPNPLQRVLFEHGLALVALQEGIHCMVHLAHDVRRRSGRGYDRVPRRRLESLEARFLHRRHTG